MRRWGLGCGIGRAWKGSVSALLAALATAGAAAQDAPASRAAEPIPCATAAGVRVRAASATDAQLACEGAARALAFLARAGLQGPAATTIDIVDALPGALAGRAVGCYIRETGGIVLLTFAAFEAGGRWFRIAPDRELYRAAAAHEMAHAVVGCQATPRTLPVAAHEYVAYVTLFATLEPATRSRVLAQFPGAGFDSTMQINDINHIVDPNRFGVDAWRHYLRRRDREGWLQQVIRGDVVPDLASDGP